MTKKTVIALVVASLIVGHSTTYALAGAPADSTQVAMDTGWVLLAAVLVMFMQAGFAMLTAGFSRAKNSCNMLMKNLMDFCFGTVAYWAVGFGLMFGAGNLLFGTSGFFLQDMGGTFASLDWTSVPLECKYFFQLVFCATSATIVAGAMAERTKFAAYIFYSVAITAFIYPIVGHWIWGGGWLAKIGMWDFQMLSLGTVFPLLLWERLFSGLAGSGSIPAALWHWSRRLPILRQQQILLERQAE